MCNDEGKILANMRLSWIAIRLVFLFQSLSPRQMIALAGSCAFSQVCRLVPLRAQLCSATFMKWHSAYGR